MLSEEQKEKNILDALIIIQKAKTGIMPATDLHKHLYTFNEVEAIISETEAEIEKSKISETTKYMAHLSGGDINNCDNKCLRHKNEEARFCHICIDISNKNGLQEAIEEIEKEKNDLQKTYNAQSDKNTEFAIIYINCVHTLEKILESLKK